MEQDEKMTFTEWMENVWYHYKWPLIFGGVIIVFLLLSFAQCQETKNPDVNILHVGPMYISDEAADAIETTLQDFAGDCDGDGEIKVEILDITVNKFGNESAGIDAVNYDKNNSALQRFQTEIRAGDAVLYALDKQYFDICVQEGILTPLEEIVDASYLPENTVDGYGIYISDLDAYELDGLSRIPETAILCLRRSPENDSIKYGRSVEVWENNRSTLEKLIMYRATEQTE